MPTHHHLPGQVGQQPRLLRYSWDEGRGTRDGEGDQPNLLVPRPSSPVPRPPIRYTRPNMNDFAGRSPAPLDPLALSQEIGAQLRRRGWTLALAESCTGGSIA